MAAASSSPTTAVDSTSPFRSVKEAIATYGEQFLARKFSFSDQHKADFIREDFVMLPPPDRGEVIRGGQSVDLSHDDGGHGGGGGDDARAYDHDGDNAHVYDHDDDGRKVDLNGLVNKLKKLEEELQETKLELKLLKEKESETEVAVASLNAKLHKSLSKIARMEATEAANMNKYTSKSTTLDRESSIESRFNEDGRAKDVNVSKLLEDRQTLDQVLSFGVCEGYFVNSKKLAKKKPVAPLITDINCLWKKKSPRAIKDEDDLAFLSPSLYSSSSMYLR